MKKAFTLIELVVAVSLLAIIFLFTATIFRVSIDSYRTSVANGEIMQKLRAITNQLNSDFAGLQTDAPLLICFQYDPNDPNQRFDQIMFFASGDFQSIQLYDKTSGQPDPYGDELVLGSVARIYYGQAQSRDRQGHVKNNPADLREEDRLLVRLQHILTDDPNLYKWPDPNDLSDFDNRSNESFEHDRVPLARWKIIAGSAYDNRVIPTCFDNRPFIDISVPWFFHKLMCEGVGSFSIQWGYWGLSGKLKWYPDYTDITPNPSGVYFNITQGSVSTTNWESGLTVADDVYPKALKFTFRLYDSKGIIKEDGRAGRKFTYIVYFDN